MVKICEVVDGCEDCPKHGDDCDGDKMTEHTDYISRADAIADLEELAERYNGTVTADGVDLAIDRIKVLPSTELPKGDLISRADVLKYPIRLDHYDEVNGDRVFVYGVESVIEYVESLPSADAVSRYAEWLEKIIVDNEGANEWLCEDTPDLEWCEKNCHYSSIQAECLRHLYEVSKGGDDE